MTVRPNAVHAVARPKLRACGIAARVIAIAMLGSAGPSIAQDQTQIQHYYDGAGNLIRRSAAQYPDLTVSGLVVGPVTRYEDGSRSFSVTFTVTNSGSVVAPRFWYDFIHLSADDALQDTDTVLTSAVRNADVPPGTSYQVAVEAYLDASVAPGSYFVIVKADAGSQNRLVESNETNNTQATAVTLLASPDLALGMPTVGSISVAQNGTYALPVSFQVTNVGGAAARAPWQDGAYLSTDSLLDNGDPPLTGSTQRALDLAPAATYSVSASFTAAATTPPGTYTLFVKTDAGASPTDSGALAEGSESDNVRSIPVVLPQRADLAISALSGGAITAGQNGVYSIPVTFTVTNAGGSAAKATWYDYGYLSANATLENTDAVLGGRRTQSVDLAPAVTVAASAVFTTTATTAPGNYTLFVKTDGNATPTSAGALVEGSETNNVVPLAITLPPRADLAISAVSIGTVWVAQSGAYQIPVSFTVSNSGGSAAKATWYDYGYLSVDATLQNTDQTLGGRSTRTADLAPGASYFATATFTSTTATAPGNYTLFVKADGNATATSAGTVVEGSESNNTQPVGVVLPTRPDLRVSAASVGTISTRTGGGYNVPVTFTVQNAGGSAAKASWYDRAYLSTDATLQGTDQILGGNNQRTTDLAAGATYSVTKTFTTSSTTAPGSYSLIVKADGGASASGQHSPTGTSYVLESDDTNNVRVLAIVLP